jgi:hypothetical protein
LIAHAESSGAYRFVVLDTPPEQTPGAALGIKRRIDSSFAALYYPWVTAPNPLAQKGNKSIAQEILLPPSGFVCGIYARNDKTRGVSKSPANETVRGALRLETNISSVTTICSITRGELPAIFSRSWQPPVGRAYNHFRSGLEVCRHSSLYHLPGTLH